jgi:RluA family pseudouridine synthase
MALKIPVLFQNNDFIAVDKPAGLSVHNNEDPDNLLKALQMQRAWSSLFPVHRLDKETSGVQVLALHDSAAKELASEFEAHNVEKIYVGVLRGQMKELKGVWKKPLTDKAEGRKNPQGLAKDRKPCETRFKVIESNAYFTMCEFQIMTGRQHQIRKHAAIAGHALVGDPRYGDKKYNERMAGLYKTERMQLHSKRVEILGVKIESLEPKGFISLKA